MPAAQAQALVAYLKSNPAAARVRLRLATLPDLMHCRFSVQHALGASVSLSEECASPVACMAGPVQAAYEHAQKVLKTPGMAGAFTNMSVSRNAVLQHHMLGAPENSTGNGGEEGYEGDSRIGR
jgi:hypothetical protein